MTRRPSRPSPTAPEPALTRRASLSLIPLLAVAACGGGSSSSSSSGSTPPGGGPETLGAVALEPDAARAVSKPYPADGTDVLLEATDADGGVWTLTVPGDALPLPVTLSLTPAAARSAGGALSPGAAVVFAPDGLQLRAPATLTFTPARGGHTHALALAAGDGSAVTFAETTADGERLAAPVRHFSAAVDAVDPAPAAVEAEYTHALAAARALASAPAGDPPAPPAKSLRCALHHPDDARGAVDAYLAALRRPESVAAQRLLGAVRARILAGDDPGDAPLQTVLSLAQRVLDKAMTAASTYGEDPDATEALVAGLYAAARDVELLGGSAGATADATALALITHAEDAHLAMLRAHDFPSLDAVRALERDRLLLGGGRTDEAQQIRDALTFELDLDDASHGPGTHLGESYQVAAGEGTLTADPALAIQGAVDLDYTAGGIVKGNITSDEPLELPGTFTVQASLVDLDPCDTQSLDLVLDRFGAEAETYDFTSGGANDTEERSDLQDAATLAFSSLLGDGGYHLTLPLASAALVGERRLEREGRNAGATFAYTVDLHAVLKHTPR